MNKNIYATLTLTQAMLFFFCSHAVSAEGPGMPKAGPDRLTRPVIRGRSYAVSSMRPESTQVAERILRAGGNAFDAAVAAQAVLALVDAPNNGVGSDAMLLVYDARASRAYSVNAEGTAPQLATIDWYNTHQQGKIPVSEGLLSGTVPGVVDAWYMLLDRWGTMTFAEVLAPAIEMAANGFVLNERLAASLKSEKLRKYPTSVQAFSLDRTWEAGAIYTVPQLAGTLSRLVEAEQEAAAGGRRAALKAARDRFLQGRHRARNGGILGTTGWTVPLRGLRHVRRDCRRAGVDRLPGLPGLEGPVREPRSGGAVRTEHSRNL